MTSNAEAMRLDSSGRLGIGTTNPGLARLKIQGGAADNYSLHVTSANGTTDLLVVTSSGAVGINTTNPSARLHVADLGGDTNSRLRVDGTSQNSITDMADVHIRTNVDNGGANRSVLKLEHTNPAGGTPTGYMMQVFGDVESQGTGTDSDQIFGMRVDGMTFFNGGNVGIGVTSPQAGLHVSSNAFIDTHGTAAATRHVTIKSGGSQLNWGNYAGQWSPSLMLQGVTAAGAESSTNFLFMSALDDTQPARMTATKGLEVYTGAVVSPASSGNLALAFDSTGRASVGGAAAPASTRLWVQGAAADDFHLRVSSQNSTGTLLVVEKGGNVGIGTAGPSEKLNVSGNVLIQSGGLGVNIVPATNQAIITNRVLTGNADAYGLFSGVTGASDVTSSVQAVYAKANSFSAAYTLSNAYALHAVNPGVGAGSSITNAYGLNIESQKVAGVSNGYGVYQTGSSDLNYFAGNFGIGTSNPATKLHLSSGVLTLDGTTAGLTVDANKASDHLAIIRQRNATGLGLRVIPGADTLAALTDNDATDAANKHMFYGNGNAVLGFNGGNVGINTNTPAFKLHLSSGSLVIDGNGGKIETASGGTLTTAACASGAGEAFVGNDMAGKITIGALGAAACMVTFQTAYANAPICVASEQTTPAAIAALPAAGSLVLTAAFAAADVINYICIGRR